MNLKLVRLILNMLIFKIDGRKLKTMPFGFHIFGFSLRSHHVMR